jgi:hypothetical protein
MPAGRIKPTGPVTQNWGHPLSNGLVLHYIFNETAGSTALDTTNPIGGKFTAAALNTPTARAAGKFGTSWSNTRSSGDQYITVNRVLNFNTYTFCWWSKVNAAPTNAVRIITPTDTNWVLWDFNNSRGVGFFNGPSAPNQPVTGVWEHYAVVFNRAASTAIIYFNGVQVASGSVTKAAPTGTWLIEAYEGNSSIATFVASLEDLRIYNRLLTPTEIQRIYERPFADIVAPRIRISHQIAGGAADIPFSPRAPYITGVGSSIGLSTLTF